MVVEVFFAVIEIKNGIAYELAWTVEGSLPTAV